MSCPHSLTGSPSLCSQCAGATPRRVSQDGPVIVVDGIPERTIEPPPGPGLKQAGRRGGVATGRITKRKT